MTASSRRAFGPILRASFFGLAARAALLPASGVRAASSSAGARKAPLPPPPKSVPHKVMFGVVAGEDRGEGVMDPPLTLVDDLFWLRDDERKDPEVLAHLRAENAHTEAMTAHLAGARQSLYEEVRARADAHARARARAPAHAKVGTHTRARARSRSSRVTSRRTTRPLPILTALTSTTGARSRGSRTCCTAAVRWAAGRSRWCSTRTHWRGRTSSSRLARSSPRPATSCSRTRPTPPDSRRTRPALHSPPARLAGHPPSPHRLPARLRPPPTPLDSRFTRRGLNS